MQAQRRYEGFLQRSDLPDRALDLLRDRPVILVPGFLSAIILRIGAIGFGKRLRLREIQIGAYFDEQLRWLRTHGIPASRLAVRSEAPVEESVDIIAEALTVQSDALIVSHSMGGLFTLATLMQRPECLRNVASWVAVQAPFAGSPLADWIDDHWLVRWILSLVLAAGENGSIESLRDLRTDRRTAFLAQHNDEVRALVNKKLICLGSSHLPRTIKQMLVFGLPHRVIRRHHLRNDGFVPTCSALPGWSEEIDLEGIDHAMPVMGLTGSIDRVRMLQALACTALDVSGPWKTGATNDFNHKVPL